MIVVQGWVLAAIVLYNVMVLLIIYYLWGKIIDLRKWQASHINLKGDQHGFEYRPD